MSKCQTCKYYSSGTCYAQPPKVQAVYCEGYVNDHFVVDDMRPTVCADDPACIYYSEKEGEDE